MKKRILSILLSLVMVLGMMPTMAFATGSSGSTTTAKNIMLGTSGLSSPTKTGNFYDPSSYIYFGAGGDYKWRVLDASKTSNGADGVFLLCEGVSENATAFGGETYQGSTVQSYVTGEFIKKFTSQEQAAMLSTTTTQNSHPNVAYTHHWYDCSLNGDKIFLPSMTELKTYVGENGSSTGLSSSHTWWTRSKSTVSDAQNQPYIGVIKSDGTYDYKLADVTWNTYYIRPAFNLDSSKVLFTSSKDIKSSQSQTGNSALTALTDYTDGEWKLTLLDTARGGFTASVLTPAESQSETTVEAGQEINVKFENAKYGSNEYISAILADKNGNALYYGRLMRNTGGTGGQTSVTIPSDLKGGEYTLYVFNEQCNDGWAADYASSFASIALTVEGSEAKVIAADGTETEYKTLSDALKAAAGNTTADVIEILGNSVTLDETNTTLKEGDSIKPYSYNYTTKEPTDCGGVIKATNDVTLGVKAYSDGTSEAKFMSGSVQFVSVEKTDADEENKNFHYCFAYFGGKATVAGMSGKTISITAGSSDDLLYIRGVYEDATEGTKEYAEDMVSISGESVSGKVVKIGDREYTIVGSGAVITVSRDGDYELDSGSIKLVQNKEIIVDGKTVKNTGENAITVTVDNTYGDSIDVPANGEVTISEAAGEAAGTKYTAGANGATLEMKTTYDDGDVTVVTLTSGSVATAGDMDAAFAGSVGTMSFTKTSESGTGSYTVNISEKTLTVPNDVTVTGCTGSNENGVEYTNGTFTFEKEDDVLTVKVPAGATVAANGVAITGVAKTESGKATTVEISEGDDDKYTFTLVAGKGKVTGEATVNVKFTDSGAEKTVAVTVPSGKTYTIDADKIPPEVSNLSKGDSVTAGGITYTVTGESSDSVFPIDGEKAQLKNNGDKAAVAGGKSAKITLGSGTAPVVTVSGANVGITTVEKTATGGKITVASEDDTFTVNNATTYTAGSGGATFTVNAEGAVALVSGSAKIGGGKSITGKSEKAITNPAESITVKADESSYKDTVTVQKGTGNAVTIGNTTYTNGSANVDMTLEVSKDDDKVKLTSGAVQLDEDEAVKVGTTLIENTDGNGTTKTITVTANTGGGKERTATVTAPTSGSKVTIGTKEYKTAENNTILFVDAKGNVTVTSGAVELDYNESITAGETGVVISNPIEDKTLTVKTDSTNGKDTVTVPGGGSVKVGSTTYGNASDTAEMVIDLTEANEKVKATITAGSATVPAGKTLVTKGIEVTNTEADGEDITVSADGTVTVPKGGQTDIGLAKITNVAKETTFTVDSNGDVEVELFGDKTVTINGADYTCVGDDVTLTIDPVTGKVIGITSVINIAIDEGKLTDDFSYELVPGQSVTIGKYIYAAPDGGNVGDVTIRGRGRDTKEKVLNPAVVLKNENGSVEVALSANEEKETIYTAANANTVFAMAADDTTTTKVELLDNNNDDANSALKFIDKKTYTVNGVTYQAQTVRDEIAAAEKAVAYTVTYGNAVVETGEKNEDGTSKTETINRNAVSVKEGSKVVVKMNAKGTVSIENGAVNGSAFEGAIPFTATNNNASIVIDSSKGGALNSVSGSGSYLTEIKDEGGKVTGYEVRKRSSGGSTSTTTTDNVTNTTEDKKTDTGSTTETTKVATTIATVKTETKTSADGTKTTTAAVDKTTANDIVEKAVANKSEEVVVNTGLAVAETAAGSTTEIQLPEQTVQGLSQKTEASVTIKSESAEVTLDKAAVDGLASQAGDDGYVKLVVETVKQDASTVRVDLKLVTSKGNVTDFKGGNVSVTVKLSATLAAKPVVCVYIDDFGTYHKVKGLKKTDGTYTFETSHFSTYAVMEEKEADKIIAEQTAEVEKLTSDLTLKARSTKTKKGNIKITLTGSSDAIKEIEDLGYTVKYKFYRSTKKSKGYQAKIEGTGKTYTNTAGTKGTKYYYKTRVMVYDAQGTLIAKTALTQCRYACRTR